MARIDYFGNCITERIGSGLSQCDSIDLDDVSGLILFEKGWSKPITNGVVDISKATYITDLKALNAFPFIGIFDFTQDTPDNETATSSSGVLSEVRAGKPQFGFNFDKGTCLHKSLWDKRAPNGGVWDYGIVTKYGLVLSVSADGTEIRAFDGGMLSVSSFKFKQGTGPQSSMATIQLLDAQEWNARMKVFSYEEIGDINRVNGVIEVNVSVDVVEDGDTTFTASVTSACNTGSPILGLDDTDLWVLGGTQASTTAIDDVSYNASTGEYTFTVDNALAENDTVKPTLSDGTYIVVEDATGNLYKGTSALVTVDAASV